jgi:HK97 family phage prohead protease
MPWHVAKSAKCPASKPFAVIKDSDQSVVACHVSKQKAQRQVAALYANEPRGGSMTSPESEETRRTFSADERKTLAKKGHAMPDGSFPIENESDLKNAIHAVGRASNPTAAKAHIKKRARALGLTKLLPEDWQQQHSEEVPRDEYYRGLMGDLELRDASEDRDGRIGTLVGHFAVFNQWTKIDSKREGTFMESIAPGAFARTIQNSAGSMRVLFQHGHDGNVGEKPLGPIEVLREDDHGAYYEVPLLDTTYNRDLVPGLEAGLYGSSFRFNVLHQHVNKKPDGRSDVNPERLPERTIKEARVREFGTVTFPAYEAAGAGMRCLSDYFTAARFFEDTDHLVKLVEFIPEEDATTAPLTPARPVEAPSVTARDQAPLYGTQKRGKPSWLLL